MCILLNLYNMVYF